jgi:hypothetical protein
MLPLEPEMEASGPRSPSPRGPAGGNRIRGVYVLRWHNPCVTNPRAGGNHYALAVVALLRGVQVSPFPPLALVPNRDPGCHPGRGLTLSLPAPLAWQMAAEVTLAWSRRLIERGVPLGWCHLAVGELDA